MSDALKPPVIGWIGANDLLGVSNLVSNFFINARLISAFFFPSSFLFHFNTKRTHVFPIRLQALSPKSSLSSKQMEGKHQQSTHTWHPMY